MGVARAVMRKTAEVHDNQEKGFSRYLLFSCLFPYLGYIKSSGRFLCLTVKDAEEVSRA